MNFTESIIEEAALAWLEGLWATPCLTVLRSCRICPGVERTEPNYRDVVLPKLISGEVRVKDAERFIEGRQ